MWAISKLFWKQKEADKPDYFAKLPTDVLQKIVDEADTSDKLVYQHLSRNFNKCVKNSPLIFKLLKMTIAKLRVVIELDDGKNVRTRIFEFHKKGHVREDPSKSWFEIWKGGYRTAAAYWFVSIFRNENVIIEKLEFAVDFKFKYKSDDLVELLLCYSHPIYIYRHFAIDRESIFNGLNHFLPLINQNKCVKHLLVSMEINEDDLMKLLVHLKPRVLETITLLHERQGGILWDSMRMDRIVETDQWKEAKNYTGHRKVCNTPFEKWSHLEMVEITLSTKNVKMVEIMKTLLQNPRFHYCTIYFVHTAIFEDIDSFMEQFNTLRCYANRGMIGTLPSGKDIFVYYNNYRLVMCMVESPQFSRLFLTTNDDMIQI